MANWTRLSAYYNLSFLHRSDDPEQSGLRVMVLWSGTQEIDAGEMRKSQPNRRRVRILSAWPSYLYVLLTPNPLMPNAEHVLGKVISQEEKYCSFGLQELREDAEHPNVTKKALLKVISSMSNFANVRYMALTRLRSTERVGAIHT